MKVVLLVFIFFASSLSWAGNEVTKCESFIYSSRVDALCLESALSYSGEQLWFRDVLLINNGNCRTAPREQLNCYLINREMNMECVDIATKHLGSSMPRFRSDYLQLVESCKTDTLRCVLPTGSRPRPTP